MTVLHRAESGLPRRLGQFITHNSDTVIRSNATGPYRLLTRCRKVVILPV
jgi:hypothetical protein